MSVCMKEVDQASFTLLTLLFDKFWKFKFGILAILVLGGISDLISMSVWTWGASRLG